MHGTDHPPSTTRPARPPLARRALGTAVVGLAAAAGIVTTAAAPSVEPPGEDITSSSIDDDDGDGRMTAFADSDVSMFQERWAEAVEQATEAAAHAEPATPAEPAEVTTTTATTVAPDPTTTTTVPPTTTTTEPPPPTTTTTTSAPPPPTTEAPPPEPAYGDPYDHATWDRLAQCEASGDWHTNTGNGYYGGLQFSLTSWEEVGGTGYPHEHSRETQIRMGIRLWERQGWSAWPRCSSQLGYR